MQQKQNFQNFGIKQQKRGDNKPMIIGTAKKYAYALLNDSEDTLNEMTLYDKGSIGSSDSNISKFKKTGAKRVIGVANNGKHAMIEFGGDNNQTACIVKCEVLDGKHVLGDWEVFGKI